MQKKFILGKKKGFLRHVQSIFAKSGSYPVELFLVKYRVKLLLSLSCVNKTATLHLKIAVNLKIVYSFLISLHLFDLDSSSRELYLRLRVSRWPRMTRVGVKPYCCLNSASHWLPYSHRHSILASLLTSAVFRYGQRESILSLLEVNSEIFQSGNKGSSLFLVLFFYLI